MFPYRLDNRSQQLMERAGGMTRGFVRLRFDWRTISAVHGGAIGIGANMSFRRTALDALGPLPFPGELDAGTPSQSGGDTFVIARLIGLGHRIIYTPNAFGFHDHRGDDAGLTKAIWGYGVGISACMSKLLVEEHELESLRGWAWLVKQHIRVQGRWLLGKATFDEVRLSARYISGGASGPALWRTALAEQQTLGARDTAYGRPLAATAERQADDGPAGQSSNGQPPDAELRLSVVIPTNRFAGTLQRCLGALAEQELQLGRFEVLVIDDRREEAPSDENALPDGLELRVLRTGGRGASAARNLGAREARADTVLFLDDDLVAETGLLERHLAHHQSPNAVAVVGRYWPDPRSRGLITQSVRLWWWDYFDSLQVSGAPTFQSMLSANMSVRRSEILGIGGFNEEIPRREDYELGLRWLAAGRRIAFDPEASARHEFTLCSADRLRAARLEGYGDAIIARDHPEAIPSLPLSAIDPASTSVSQALTAAAVARPRARRLTLALLGALEGVHLRTAWQRLFGPLQHAAYRIGVSDAATSVPAVTPPSLDCELLQSGICRSAKVVAPRVRVLLRGTELASVQPSEGLWEPKVADQIVDMIPAVELERLAVARGWIRAEDSLTPAAAGLGTTVLTASADRGSWQKVASVAESNELIAVVLSGSMADERWLREAVVGFDGERVGAMFGRAVADDRAVQPLFLHDHSLPPEIRAGSAPHYLIVRRDALSAVGGVPVELAALGRLAPALAILSRLKAGGWVIGRRDVHGLVPGPATTPDSAREFGRALAIAEILAQDASAVAVWRHITTVLARASWEEWKALTGRAVDTDTRRWPEAAGAIAGTTQALLRRSP